MGKPSNKGVKVTPVPRASRIAETAASARRVLQSHLELTQGAIGGLKDELAQLHTRHNQMVVERNGLLDQITRLSAAQDDRQSVDNEWQRIKSDRDRLQRTSERLHRENETLLRRTELLEHELVAERSRRVSAEQELDYLAQQAEQLKSLTRQLRDNQD